jgi:hypothetical protein
MAFALQLKSGDILNKHQTAAIYINGGPRDIEALITGKKGDKPEISSGSARCPRGQAFVSISFFSGVNRFLTRSVRVVPGATVLAVIL